MGCLSGWGFLLQLSFKSELGGVKGFCVWWWERILGGMRLVEQCSPKWDFRVRWNNWNKNKNLNLLASTQCSVWGVVKSREHRSLEKPCLFLSLYVFVDNFYKQPRRSESWKQLYEKKMRIWKQWKKDIKCTLKKQGMWVACFWTYAFLPHKLLNRLSMCVPTSQLKLVATCCIFSQIVQLQSVKSERINRVYTEHEVQ